MEKFMLLFSRLNFPEWLWVSLVGFTFTGLQFIFMLTAAVPYIGPSRSGSMLPRRGEMRQKPEVTNYKSYSAQQQPVVG